MSKDIEARLGAAVDAGDDAAFNAALREATFYYPVLNDPTQSTWSPLRLGIGEVLCTSRELALQAIRRAEGDTSGWTVRRLPVDEATTLLHDVPFVVLNPGTPMQRDLSIPWLMKQWRRAGTPCRPHKPKLAFWHGSWALIFAVGCLVVGLGVLTSGPECAGQAMGPGDRCNHLSDPGVFPLDAEDAAENNTRLGLIFLGAGLVLAVFAVRRFVVGIRYRSALRRYEREHGKDPTPTV